MGRIGKCIIVRPRSCPALVFVPSGPQLAELPMVRAVMERALLIFRVGADEGGLLYPQERFGLLAPGIDPARRTLLRHLPVSPVRVARVSTLLERTEVARRFVRLSRLYRRRLLGSVVPFLGVRADLLPAVALCGVVSRECSGFLAQK